MTSTVDGKNRNPIVSNNKSQRNRNFEFMRLKNELDEHVQDEIDSFEGKNIKSLIFKFSICFDILMILNIH